MNQDVRKAKEAVVQDVVTRAKESQTVIIAEYRGLTVAQLQTLRRALREVNASTVVVKNSLFELAAKELGYEIGDLLTGPNAFFFSKDACEGPKVVAKYAKRFGDFLKIKGGVVEGKVVSAETIQELAKIPGREGLISMFLSCLQAPVRQFACAVKAVAESK